jgi:hypothetical protein
VIREIVPYGDIYKKDPVLKRRVLLSTLVGMLIDEKLYKCIDPAGAKVTFKEQTQFCLKSIAGYFDSRLS